MSDPFDFSPAPDRYAVMGNPIAHSKSPDIHARFATQTDQDIEYTAILVEPGGFPQAVGNFQASGGKGLNVTVPFKHEAWKLADQLTERARLAGAVNTLVFQPDGSVQGDNTDGIGLVRDIRDHHSIPLQGISILLLGAGGAARGVLEPLLAEQPAQLVIANRTEEKAVSLAAEFKHLGKISGCSLQALAGQHFDLVINATSASLHGDLPPLPDDLLNKGASCYDMMYGAEPTVFMQWALQHGAEKCLDGLGMLVGQAAESFALWRGVRPEVDAVIQYLRKKLSP
ncbi:MAG: shikimate dehydrogenase [Gammaproteobacteria bacterium]|nr:shikimate dehydrogenase [Gammaproteobacteria bacterium]